MNDPKLRAGMLHLIDNILAVKPEEQVAFIHDSSYRPMIAEAKQVLQERRVESISVELGEQYDPSCLPAGATECFLDREHMVIIIGTRENIWHNPERRKAKKRLGKRLVNLIHPSTEPVPSLVTDPKLYAEIGNVLDARMRKGTQWRITAPGGTDLTGEFPVKETGFFFERGDYTQSGKGGDFPSGEVGFGPEEGSIKGTISFDLKVQHVGLLKIPVNIAVDNDRIKVLSNNEESRRYASLIGRNPVLSLISEVSFGINPDWSTSNEPLSIVEEKNLGTAHFGHGGNWSYGCRKGPHFDAVILKPDLTIDDELIISGGRMFPRDQERQ